MADLIDRQVTINEIKALYEWHDTVTEDRVIDHLMRLPSAQPDVPDTNVGDMISRQAAIEAMGCVSDSLCEWQAIDALCELPSVEAEPVRQTAEWIYGEKDGADGWYCSKCGFHIPWYYEYYGLNNINFIRDFHTCPHCDSKMMKYTGMDEVT